MIHLSCLLHPGCRISDINTSVLARKVVLSIYIVTVYIYYTYYTQRFQNLGNKTCKLDLGATKTSRISRLCLNPFNRKAKPYLSHLCHLFFITFYFESNQAVSELPYQAAVDIQGRVVRQDGCLASQLWAWKAPKKKRKDQRNPQSVETKLFKVDSPHFLQGEPPQIHSHLIKHALLVGCTKSRQLIVCSTFMQRITNPPYLQMICFCNSELRSADQLRGTFRESFHACRSQFRFIFSTYNF